MPLCRSFLILLLCVSVGWSAEVRTLKGEVLKGNVTNISEKDITLLQGDTRTDVPVSQVLQVDFAEPGRLPADARYSDVELTDGTLLHCGRVLIKGKQAELTLLGGQEVKVPLATVASILNDAQNEAFRKEWASRLARKRRRDVIAVRKKDEDNPGNVIVSGLEGTAGEGDESGAKIEFSVRISESKSISRTFALATIHGLIFLREPDPKAPPVLCRLTDMQRDLVVAASANSTATGLEVVTPAGARIEYKNDSLARLDYSKGKLTFLSDLEPSKVAETSTDEVVYNYKRDRNLENGPLRLAGISYARGLALHATTELEYDLGGDYREFKAVAGIDEQVGGIEGPTQLRIEGDGKELYSKIFNRLDKTRPETITLNIKDVQKLRIVVSSGDLLDLGKHLDLADAKVSK